MSTSGRLAALADAAHCAQRAMAQCHAAGETELCVEAQALHERIVEAMNKRAVVIVKRGTPGGRTPRGGCI